MEAIVLAGGRGVRLRHLTENNPKALVEIKGKSLLEYTLDNLVIAGVKKTVIVIGYLGEKIKEKIGKEYKGMEIVYALQKEPLGSGHAMIMAEPYITKDRFFLCSCDIIFATWIYEKLAREEEVLVTRYIYGDPSRFGVVVSEDGFLKEIREKPKDLPEGKYSINAFLHICRKDIFDYLKKIEKIEGKEIHYVDALKESNKKRTIKTIPYKGPIVDVSTPEEVEEANKRTEMEFPEVKEI